ncbi:hypothetical protein QUB47_09235 [Microcoleus sp. AT9_B5]
MSENHTPPNIDSRRTRNRRADRSDRSWFHVCAIDDLKYAVCRGTG